MAWETGPFLLERFIMSFNEIVKPTIERNIIGLCLKSADNYNKIIELGIHADMFLQEANKYIFQSIEYLVKKGQEPTPSAIIETVGDMSVRRSIQAFGGEDYLITMRDSFVREGNIEIFCDKLKQAYTRSEMLEILEIGKTTILSDKAESLNVSELISSIEQPLATLQSNVMNTIDVYKMGNDLEERLALRAESPNEIPGIKTGMERLDHYTSGGQPGDLIIVCARAKTGKSTMLTNWAVNACVRNKKPILYIDTEMSSVEQEDRMLSIISGIPHREIITGMYTIDTSAGLAEDKKRRIQEASMLIKESNYYHIYMPDFTSDKITALANSYKQKHGIEALYFDYIKFPMAEKGYSKGTSEWQLLGYVTASLKDIAGKLGIPVFAACQENRSNLDGVKDERNVGGSDRILQLATKLMFLYNKREDEVLINGKGGSNQTLKVAFQRNGAGNCPDIDIHFNGDTLTQKEL